MRACNYSSEEGKKQMSSAQTSSLSICKNLDSSCRDSSLQAIVYRQASIEETVQSGAEKAALLHAKGGVLVVLRIL